MKTPRIEIALQNIEENARIMNDKCQARGIELTGVVKGAAGDERVAGAFVRGGIEYLGDSRLRNIKTLRAAGYEEKMLLLRLPSPAETDEVVKYCDVSLNSEVKTLRKLSASAVRLDKTHGVIIMVDVGDLREGVLAENLADFFSQIISLPGLRILGLGTNVGCYGGVLPTRENTELLVKLRDRLEEKYELDLQVISGGSTVTTALFADNSLPAEINNLRIGEAILKGTDITRQRVIDYLNQHNFRLVAGIIEMKEKPSVPWGKKGKNSFGREPSFEDRGLRRRAILDIGKQDVNLDGLTPEAEGAEILGGSSDHLLVDVTDVRGTPVTGTELGFRVNYGAMLRLMTSAYVEKIYI